MSSPPLAKRLKSEETMESSSASDLGVYTSCSLTIIIILIMMIQFHRGSSEGSQKIFE